MTAYCLYHSELFLHGLTANGVNDQLSHKWGFGEVINGISRKMNEARQNCYNEFGLISLSSQISPKVYTLRSV